MCKWGGARIHLPAVHNGHIAVLQRPHTRTGSLSLLLQLCLLLQMSRLLSNEHQGKKDQGGRAHRRLPSLMLAKVHIDGSRQGAGIGGRVTGSREANHEDDVKLASSCDINSLLPIFNPLRLVPLPLQHGLQQCPVCPVICSRELEHLGTIREEY